jgi:hypothetical protein
LIDLGQECDAKRWVHIELAGIGHDDDLLRAANECGVDFASKALRMKMPWPTETPMTPENALST